MVNFWFSGNLAGLGWWCTTQGGCVLVNFPAYDFLEHSGSISWSLNLYGMRADPRLPIHKEPCPLHGLRHLKKNPHSRICLLMFRKNPGWCASVDWAPVCRPRGCQFNPSHGTYLGCRPGPQLGVCERQLINVSLVCWWCFSPSSLSLKINKLFFF